MVHCHIGERRSAAASFLIDQGFTNVKSLKGGIDAWSLEIDPRIPGRSRPLWRQRLCLATFEALPGAEVEPVRGAEIRARLLPFIICTNGDGGFLHGTQGGRFVAERLADLERVAAR